MKVSTKGQKLFDLISPEILAEIRQAFRSKYSVGICFYDPSGTPLSSSYLDIPSLNELGKEQKDLFALFFDLKAVIQKVPQKGGFIIQQFAGGRVLRCIDRIHLGDESFGFVCMVDIRKPVDSKMEAGLLSKLAELKRAREDVNLLEDDEQNVLTSDFMAWNQELRQDLQLFLEAGKARAHIDALGVEKGKGSDDLMKTGILFCTTGGLIIEALPDAVDLLGYSTEALCDLNLFDDILVEEADRKILRDRTKTKSSDPSTALLRRKNGDLVEATIRFLPQKNGSTFLGFECHITASQNYFLHDAEEYERDQAAIGLIADISPDEDEFELPDHFDLQPFEKEAPLPQSNKKSVPPRKADKSQSLFPLMHLLNASDTPSFLVNDEGSLVLYNKAAADVLESSADRFLKRPVTDFIVANFHATWQRWQKRLLNSPDGSVLRPKVLLPLIKSDGSIIMCAVRFSRFAWYGSRYLFLVVRPEKQADKGVQADAAPSRDRVTFSDNNAAVQHFYKNVRRQFAQIAESLSENLSSAYLQSLQNVESKKRFSAIKRIADISAHIDHSLSYFTGEKKPKLELTDVNRLIEEIEARLRQFLPINIDIETTLAQSLPPVMADADMLVHAFGTLCKNAVEAMPGGGTLTIATQTAMDGQNVVVAISDTGIGFSADLMNNPPIPFLTSKRNGLGKGLGLAAAFGILRIHDGQLILQNNPEGGARVDAVLPAYTQEQGSEEQDQPVAQNKGFVLVIDDEIDLAEATAMTLTRDGYFVITSSSAADGLAMYEMYKDEIDLVVIDNMLTDSKGLECAKKIRAIDNNVQLVFYSGADDDYELARFIQETNSGWLKKPFKIKELITLIESRIVNRDA